MQTQKRVEPNYLLQLNAFHRWLGTHYLPANARLLWFMLIALCNMCGWEEWIQVDGIRIMQMIDVTNDKAAYRARDALVEAGLLEYRKGRKGCPNLYRLLFFDVPERSESGSESGSQNGSQSGSQNGSQNVLKTGDINKQNKTRTKPNTKKTREENLLSAGADGGARARVDFQSVADLWGRICVSLPQVQTLNDKRKKAIRAAVQPVEAYGGWEKLFRAVEQSDFLTGRSGAWIGCCFDWVLKPANLVKIIEGNYANANERRGSLRHDDSINVGIVW